MSFCSLLSLSGRVLSSAAFCLAYPRRHSHYMDAQLCTNTAFHATTSLYPEQGHAAQYSLRSCFDQLGHPTPAAAKQHPVQAGMQPCSEPALPGCTSPSASGWVQALHWEEVASSSPRDSVASEGLSLLAVPSQGCLLAFGGYNGRYHSNVQLFRPGAAPKAATGSIFASQTATDMNLQHVPRAACCPLQATVGATTALCSYSGQWSLLRAFKVLGVMHRDLRWWFWPIHRLRALQLDAASSGGSSSCPSGAGC